MRYRPAICAIALTIGVAVALVYAQTRTAADGDEQAIRKATDAFAAAFNKGDVDGMLSVWTDRPEYVDDTGKSITGRVALAAMYKKLLQDQKGVKLKIAIGVIRIVKDDVAMQDGNSILTYANGDTDATPFTALWMKKEGTWLLHLVRDLGSEPTEPAASAGVKELAWLVGDWVSEDKEGKTTISGHWLKGEKFLALHYSMSKKGKVALALTKVIGWDPVGQRLQSWSFDSRGGFGEGCWTKEGKSWSVATAGVTADGRQGTGKMVWTPIDADSFVHQSLDRFVDGQPFPDKKTKYQRAKAGFVPPERPEGATSEQLKDLAWVVGNWTAEDKDMKTTINARWTKGGKFMVLDYAVRSKGEDALALTQVIGWDPTGQQIHSWVFDSRGGFGEGCWSKEDKAWAVATAGVTADGRQGIGKMVLTHGDNDSFIHECSDRSVDGEPLPDRKTRYQRVENKK